LPDPRPPEPGTHRMITLFRLMMKRRAAALVPPPLPGAIDKADAAAVTADLKRLEKLDPALARKAIGYVLTGDGGSVLLELEQRAEAARPLLGSRYRDNREHDGTKARQRLLTRRHGPDAAWLRRYGEVLSVQHIGSSWGVGTHQGPSPLWLRTLLDDGCESGKKPPSLCADFADMLGWCDPEQSRSLVALDILVIETETSHFRKCLGTSFYDFKQRLPEDFAAISVGFKLFDRPGQVIVIDLLKQLGLIAGPYFDLVYDQYLSTTSKQVRGAAQNALLASPAASLGERAKVTLEEGNPGARAMAAQLLPLVLKDQARPILEAHLAKETAKTVRKVIELGLGAATVAAADAPDAARSLAEDGPAGYLAADGTEVLAPAVVAPPGPSPLPAGIRAAYQKMLERQYDNDVKNYEQRKAYYATLNDKQRQNWRSGPPKMPGPVDPHAAERYCDVLEGTDPVKDHAVQKLDRFHAFTPWAGNQGAAPPYTDPALTLWHLARAQALQKADHFRGMGNILAGSTTVGAAIRARLVDGLDLRSLETLFQPPVAPHAIASTLMGTGWSTGRFDLPDLQVWPYLCGQFGLLDEAMGLVPAKRLQYAMPRSGMDLLQTFPKLPARYFVTVLGHAISGQKMLSAPARALLLTVDGVESRLLPHLQDGKQEVRIGVATMLGRIGAAGTVEPLRQALAREKSELARAAMLGALDRLGFDISTYLTPDLLVKEAAAGLKAQKVKGIDWFPFAALPALEWAGGGAVPAEVPRWWILLAVKLAQPGGNALFSLWLDQLAPASAEALGRFVLASWLGYDTVHCSETEANDYAQANAQARFDQMQKYAKQYNSEYYAAYTYERIFAELRRGKLSVYLNNAYAERGMLGLAARADGAQAVSLVRAYMRDSYTRTSQVRALTEYLGGHASTSTLQFLLSIARRHRTKQVQALAGELVERIADERGWTADELADRTVPTAGLDERGVLELPIGDRAYELKLEADDSLALYNPAGKVVQSLPQIKEGPDKEAADEAKAAVTNAKKELKQVFEFQAKRLYEALCVGRRWPVADWRRYLLEHPLVGRLAQRVIWLGLDAEGKVVTAFRPMADLSLTDAADNEVDLDSVETVQLAHRSLFSAEAAAAWAQHLDDYKVAPLFEQLERPLLAAPTGTALEDRSGHIIEAFKLRTAANKLGYERAPAEDGGWFTEYLKPFASIGITAVIEFTGSPLPEENREVALVEAKFRQVSGKRRYGREMPLADVPPVLLSEVWNDLHQVAAAGSGFAADWQKRTAY
jgi:hypothetical protein